MIGGFSLKLVLGHAPVGLKLKRGLPCKGSLDVFAKIKDDQGCFFESLGIVGYCFLILFFFSFLLKHK